MRELRQKKKDDRAAAKAAILREKAEKKAARKAAAEAKKLKVLVMGLIRASLIEAYIHRECMEVLIITKIS